MEEGGTRGYPLPPLSRGGTQGYPPPPPSPYVQPWVGWLLMVRLSNNKQQLASLPYFMPCNCSIIVMPDWCMVLS